MRDYIILNGVNSNTISGLLISTLPSISKPKIRTQTEEIDGRDGDIVTKLGYSAYDKEIEIGLYGNFDINEVIEYFNSEGTVVFSNENDKYYNYQILEQIDFEKLIRFKTAKVKMHVQPFKYPTEETPVEIEYQYVTGGGTNITLDNTDNALMQLDLNPSELTQATRSGKNLFDSSQIVNVSDYIVANGTGIKIIKTTNGRVSPLYNISLKANTEYTISCNLTSTTTYPTMYCQWRTNDGSTLWAPNLPNGSTTFTPSKDIVGVIFYLQGTDTDGTYVELTNLQIEKGSATDYEPYGVMPSPDYPSEVQVIKGNNSIKISNSDNTEQQVLPLNLPVENLSDIVLDENTTNTTLFKTYTLKPNTSYTISTNTYVAEQVIANVFAEQGTSFTPSTLNNGINGFKTITSDNNGNITIGYRNYEKILDYSTGKYYIQLEEGTKANRFTPYGTTPIEYCKIGTYEDEFEYDGDKWYLNKYIGKVVFNGSEIWGYGDSGVEGIKALSITLNDMLSGNYLDGSSNYFHNDKSGKAKNSIRFGANSKLIYIYVDETEFTSLTDCKSWLSTHNVEVYYVLETPTHEEITDTTLISQLNTIEKALSYDGQTNISQTNTGLPFIISASALEKGSNTATVNNTGNIYSKPTIDIEGSGTVDIYLNNNQMFSVDLSNSNECVIDTTNLEAYNPSNSALMNRQVTGDYSNFKLNTGENAVKVNGNVTKVTITDYTRWL